MIRMISDPYPDHPKATHPKIACYFMAFGLSKFHLDIDSMKKKLFNKFYFLLQLSISMKFFADLQKYGADEVGVNYFLSYIIFLHMYVMLGCDYYNYAIE